MRRMKAPLPAIKGVAAPPRAAKCRSLPAWEGSFTAAALRLPPCRRLAATRCNLASCARHCLYGWSNPLSASSTLGNGTTLNACMQCDEVHCSAYFLQACVVFFFFFL